MDMNGIILDKIINALISVLEDINSEIGENRASEFKELYEIASDMKLFNKDNKQIIREEFNETRKRHSTDVNVVLDALENRILSKLERREL